MENKTDILSLTPAELQEFIISLGEPRYRADQIYTFLMRGAATFAEMTNIPKKLIEKLENTAFIASAKQVQKLTSKDGTVKYLYEMYDGEKIESVVMKYHYGNTICISSEAGCAMGCAFCASTLGGISRKLLPSELLSQVIQSGKDLGERIDGVVLMGIGEPLDNYDNVVKFLRLVNEEKGLNIGLRHISLSTCGIVPRIYDLAKEGLPITLSVSLHASNDETRSALMPVNKRWNIEALLTACRDYFASTGRRISFEYTLISGKNATEQAARELSAVLRKYCSSMPIHVNLIPVNAVKERGFTPSDKADIAKFAAILEKNHIVATVRRHLGSDIDASCGQLRAKSAQNQAT